MNKEDLKPLGKDMAEIDQYIAEHYSEIPEHIRVRLDEIFKKAVGKYFEIVGKLDAEKS